MTKHYHKNKLNTKVVINIICKLCGHDRFFAETDDPLFIVDSDGFFDHKEVRENILDWPIPIEQYVCQECSTAFKSFTGGNSLVIGFRKKRRDAFQYVRGVDMENLLATMDTNKAIRFDSRMAAHAWLKVSCVAAHYTYRDLDFFILDEDGNLQPITFYVALDQEGRYLWAHLHDPCYANHARMMLSASKFLTKDQAFKWVQSLTNVNHNAVSIRRIVRTPHKVSET